MKKPKFPPEAIDVFRHMQALEARCSCIDPGEKYWEREMCPACEAWWREHSTLHDLLGLKPWQPAIEHPDAGCAPGTDPVHEAARQRYRELARASTL